MYCRTRAALRLALATPLVLLAACADDLPTTRATPPPGETVRAGIVCTVTVASGQLRCGDAPAGGGARNIMLGGQGTYVRLEASNHAYDSAAAAYSIDVTVQNLLGQQMGTPDGSTVTGVKVFFDRPPTASVGTGEVAVANADGRAAFTGANQPYFDYPEILEARGASRPRTWRFDLPGGVTAFTFGVYVETQLPAEQGVLRWRGESGAAYSALFADLYAVWVGGANDVFAGSYDHVVHWDGNEWTSLPLETGGRTTAVRDLAGSSRRQLYAVGDWGRVWRYDGNRWGAAYGDGAQGFNGYLEGVWARGDTVVAVGRGLEADIGGQVVVSTNGEDFTRTVHPGPGGTRQLWDVSGTSTANLWAVGVDERPTDTGRTRAVVLHSTDGGATWTEQIHEDAGHRYYYAVWTLPGRIIVGGGRVDIPNGRWSALLMESTDGGETWTESWFATPWKNLLVLDVWAAPDGTVHAVGGDGLRLIDTGSGWTDVSGTSTSALGALHGAGGEAWAVGQNGAVMRHRNGAWAPVDLRATTPGTLRSVWGSSATDVYAVGSRPGVNAEAQGVLMHNDGTGWSTVLPASDGTEHADVWGSGPSDVYVVGNRVSDAEGRTGVIWHYDGSGWTSKAPPNTGWERRFTAVWGSGPGDVWVLGRQMVGGNGHQTVMLHSTDGGATWAESVLDNAPDGEGHVLDAWGTGPANIYAVGWRIDRATWEPRSLVMRYNGSVWTAVTTTDSVRLSGVWGSGPDNVYVAGHWREPRPFYEPHNPWEETGIIRRTQDGGATWTERRFPGTRSHNRGLHGIWGASATQIYAVGAGPVLYFDGVDWREQGSPGWPRLSAVWGSSARDVFAVGENASIVHGIR